MEHSSEGSSQPVERSLVATFVPRPDRGRRYVHRRRVRVSDAGLEGALRLDGLARYLQDVATDDWADAGLSPDDIWVVRRTTVRVADGGHWPSLGDDVDLTTWCGGTGPAWAERRTDLEVSGLLMIETVALWVPLDSSGRPLRLGQEFHDVYGEAAAGRRVPGRVPVAPMLNTATGRPWPIRQADLDIVGHVNNAAAWAAVTEVAGGPVTSAALTHHGPLENGRTVTMLTGPGRMCLMIDGETRVSAEFAPL
ncbi:MAG: acyl-ACP thioesterase domain-containing protein [Acidimicrobiales bacterium]|jgi:acyl-ACP thioesterase